MTGRAVLADLLCAAADDLELPITRQLADEVADRMAELLTLAGYELVHDRAALLDTCTKGGTGRPDEPRRHPDDDDTPMGQ